MDSKVLAQDNIVVTQPGYLLTVNVPSHPFGTSTIGISITTENGYTDQANIPTAGNPSWTFNIPPNQGNSVQVCVNSGALSEENCHIYKTTGSSMSVSLPAISGSSNSGNTNVARDSTHNSNGNSDNNKSLHDDGSNNNSNENSHRNHHIGDASHFNSDSDNSRSSDSHHNNAGNSTNSNDNSSGGSGSHHGINTHNKEFRSGSGFNGNQGNIFHGIGSAGSNTHQGDSHNGFDSGSGNSNGGIGSNINNNNKR